MRDDRRARPVRCVVYRPRLALLPDAKGWGKVAKTPPTQVGQAPARLGIRHIPSYSPEGRGRMERVFGTLQQRLPPELPGLG